ncbi:hypothetical protein R8Z50_22315 [Longispora sp. K20-0274]|uniref:hypothetical protein n=1 Tax=Longispora sp. K20-0274 TaxID=3088255 RepID=UPI00399B9B51
MTFTFGRCDCQEVGVHLVVCHALLTLATRTLTDLGEHHRNEPRLADAASHAQAATVAIHEAAGVLTRTCPTHRAARRTPGLVAIAVILGVLPAATGVSGPLATTLLGAAGMVSLRVVWLTRWAVCTVLATRRATRASQATIARAGRLHPKARGRSVMAVTVMVGDVLVVAGLHADAAARCLDATGPGPARATLRAILARELPAHLVGVDDALTAADACSAETTAASA